MIKTLSQADLTGLTDKHGIARHIGVGLKTLTKMMNAGKIPYMKLGKGRRSPVRLSISKVERALSQQFEVPLGRRRAPFPPLLPKDKTKRADLVTA
jgi:hypothetical protein